MDALRRYGHAAVLTACACTANPPQPAPVAEPTPPPVAPETPPAPEPTPTPTPAPEPTPEPVALGPAGTLTLHPVLFGFGYFADLDQLPSGHVLYHDEAYFAVLPMGEPKPAKPAKPGPAEPPAPKDSPAPPDLKDSPTDTPAAEPADAPAAPAANEVVAPRPPQGNGAVTLHALPEPILAGLDLDLDSDEDEDEDDEASMEEHPSLEVLHGAWPDHLYATLEENDNRTGPLRTSMQWKGDRWVDVPKIDDPDFTLSLTHERFHPWTRGRYLAERELSCYEGCPDEFPDDMDEGDRDRAHERAQAKIQRRLDRQIERHKPLAVIGSPTALPDMAGIYASDTLALPTGDLWITQSSGTADRWNLTKKTWEKHALPDAKTGSYTRLAGTSTGAAWFSRCQPTPVLAFLEGGITTTVALPAAGCVTRMAVDAKDTLWVTLTADGLGINGPMPTLWRLENPKATWQPVELAPVVLPATPPAWVSDGRTWEPLDSKAGSYAPRVSELFIQNGEIWALVAFDGTTLHAVVRDRPFADPLDVRSVAPPFDDVAACLDQHIELGTLAAGVDPATAWPAALAILTTLATDDFDPRLYEVERDGTRTFHATLREKSPSARVGLQVRLKALVPSVSDVRCGLPPRPTREHELPEPPEPPDEQGEPEAP